MTYLTSFGYLLGITGLLSMIAGVYAAENGRVLIGYGAATLVCGVLMWFTGRRYKR